MNNRLGLNVRGLDYLGLTRETRLVLLMRLRLRAKKGVNDGL